MSENIALAPRFASDEHEEIGDSVRLRLVDGTEITTKSPYKLGYSLRFNNQLTYGQILALGGDYYGVPSAPISEGGGLVSECEAIVEDFTGRGIISILMGLSWAIPEVFAQKLREVEALITKSAPFLKTPDEARSGDRARFKSPEELFALAYETLETADFQEEVEPLLKAMKKEASGDALGGKVHDTVKFNNLTNGRYLALLLTNWDHFGVRARQAYSAGHAVALRQALKARQTKSQMELELAYSMNAFADHYLSDLFSGGHIRTPRRELGGALALGAMASNWMHDEDGSNGVLVRNKRGDIWVAYGDGKLASTDNATNRRHLTEAVGASADEIFTTFQSGQLPKEYSALQLIPDLERAQNYTHDHEWNNVNGAAMFIWQSFEKKPDVQVRSYYQFNNFYTWRPLLGSESEALLYYRQVSPDPYQHGNLARDNTATIWRSHRPGSDGTEVFFYAITPQTPFAGSTPEFRAFPLQVQDSVKVYLYTRKISDRSEDLVYRYTLDGNIAKNEKDYTARGVAFFAYRDPRPGWIPVYLYTAGNSHFYYSLATHDDFAAVYGFQLATGSPEFYVKAL